MHLTVTKYLADEAATLAFAQDFAKGVSVGMVVYFNGDLGAGKTTFARGLLHGLGHQGKVKSPTYTLVEPYFVNGVNLYHFDLYRFNDEEEWEAEGFREYFHAGSICLVEWPEKAANLLPSPDITIQMQVAGSGRQLTLLAHTPSGKRCLEQLNHA